MPDERKNAGLLLRTAAKAIDFILIAAVIELIPKAGYLAGLVYLLIGDGLFDGRSIGKKLLNIKVVLMGTGGPGSFKESILRNSTLALGFFLWVIPWIGWVFIFIISAFECILILGSKDGTRFGDEIAKTVVVEN
jgi:hypothetical protein